MQPKVTRKLLKANKLFELDKDSALAKSGCCRQPGTQFIRLALFVVVVTLILLFVAYFAEIQLAAIWFLEAISGMGFTGMVILGLVNVLGAVLLIPSLVFTLAAGFLYGVVAGTILISVSCTIATITAFLIARHLARSTVERTFGSMAKFQFLDRAIRDEGFMLVMLIRCSPVHPYAILNYLFGVTSISFTDYAVASFIGMFPSIVMEVFFGSGLKTVADLLVGHVNKQEDQFSRLYFWGGLVITLISTLWVTFWVKRKLASKMEGYQTLGTMDRELDEASDATVTPPSSSPTAASLSPSFSSASSSSSSATMSPSSSGNALASAASSVVIATPTPTSTSTSPSSSPHPQPHHPAAAQFASNASPRGAIHGMTTMSHSVHSPSTSTGASSSLLVSHMHHRDSESDGYYEENEEDDDDDADRGFGSGHHDDQGSMSLSLAAIALQTPASDPVSIIGQHAQQHYTTINFSHSNHVSPSLSPNFSGSVPINIHLPHLSQPLPMTPSLPRSALPTPNVSGPHSQQLFSASSTLSTLHPPAPHFVHSSAAQLVLASSSFDQPPSIAKSSHSASSLNLKNLDAPPNPSQVNLTHVL